MANLLANPADVVNDALKRIGYKLRVASLYDGSEAAGLALDIYGQTRDVLMRDGDWQFVERNVNAALLKSAPPGGYFPPNAWTPAAYPPVPWLYSFTFPSDCLKIRALKQQPLFPINADPQPVLYSVLNDNGYATPTRVIVCNIPNPILVYAGRVTNPLDWPVDFAESLSAALARRLAPSLGNLDVERLEAQDEASTTGVAQMMQG